MPSSNSRTIAVVGGGISGLTAAWTIAKEDPGAEVILLEADGRLGGKIKTQPFVGGYVEAGADSFVAREPWAVDLCRELGLEEELKPPQVFGALLWVEGQLRRLPPNLLYGIPTRPRAVMAAPLSGSGRLRASRDLFLPGPLEGPDISVSELVRRRFGPQVLERLVDPLLGGTRAGLADEISLAAALPQVDIAARTHRSVMKGLAAQRKAGDLGTGPPPFLSLDGGMQRLIDKLRDELEPKVDLRTNWPVDIVERKESGYEIKGPETLQASHVLFATPTFATAHALRNLSSLASRSLGAIDYVSTLGVSLSFDRPLDVPESTSGVLVPRVANLTLSAVTWWSVKWPDATPDRFVARCFIGRNMGDPTFDLSDEQLIDLCLDDIQTLAGSKAELVEARVDRWERGMPIYRVGHLGRVGAAEEAVEKLPGVDMTGAGLRGSGLPDCIRQAREAAHRILGHEAR